MFLICIAALIIYMTFSHNGAEAPAGVEGEA
jgi:hypothetical protein